MFVAFSYFFGFSNSFLVIKFMFEINETHDQNLKSWIESANAPDTDFPIQNLPFVRYKFGNTDEFIGRLGVPEKERPPR